MCNNKLSNTTLSSYIINLLSDKGVHKVCISPGSRNTPLTQAFINSKKIKCFSHIDERASAYFALGICKTSKEPVAVLTTSGTAAANLLPAVIEASLNKSPLFLLTADRPTHLINTGASQTINQINLFNYYVRNMIDIDLSKKSINSVINNLHKSLDKAFGVKGKYPPGPVHINIRFDEPLIDDETVLSIDKKQNKIKKFNVKQINFQKSRKPLIICGPLNENYNLENIINLAKRINAPILADNLSQLRFSKYSKNVNVYYDLYINAIVNKPDLILRFGDKPVSKNLNKFIDLNKKITHLIYPFGLFNDDCKNIISLDDNQLDNIKIKSTNDKLLNEIHELELKSSQKINRLISNSNSQANIVMQTLKILQNNDKIFIGSSTIIRTFDQFSNRSNVNIQMLSNHVTRGIDGTVSSALGMASTNKKTKNYLFIGDISLFYDLNGLHILRTTKIDLTIIVFNNKGGQIFSRLPYSNNDIKEFEQFWITPLKTKIKNIAKLYNLTYYRASKKNINEIIIKSKNKKGITIIEVKINNKKDMSFIGKINKTI